MTKLINLLIEYIKTGKTRPLTKIFERLDLLKVKALYNFLKDKALKEEILALSTREIINTLYIEKYAKVLLFLFLVKKYNLQWSFDEEKTAKLISFIFFYNIKKNSDFTTAFKPLKFILSPTSRDRVESVILDLPTLSPHDIVKNLPPLLFDYVLRTTNDFAFPVVYLLFLKDNEKLKEVFFSKLSIKALVKTSKHNYDYTTVLEKIKTVDKHKDNIFIYNEKVVKKIKESFQEIAKEKAKLLTLLINSPSFSKLIHDKEELEKVELFTTKATNPEKYKSEVTLREYLSIAPYFKLHDKKEFWDNVSISFSLSIYSYVDFLSSFERTLKELGERLNKKLLYTPQDLDWLVKKYTGVVTSFALIQAFFEDNKKNNKLYDFSYLLTLLEIITQKEKALSSIYKIVEEIKKELLKIREKNLPLLIEEFLQFKKQVSNIKNLTELSELYIKELTHYLLGIYIHSEFKEEVLRDLNKKEIETIPVEKYVLVVNTKLQSILKNLNPNDFKQIKKLINMCFDEIKIKNNTYETIAVITFLLKDIVKLTKSKKEYYPYVKKLIKKETLPLGYIFLTEEVDLESKLEEEKLFNLLKKAVLVLNLVNIFRKQLKYNPFKSFNLLYKRDKCIEGHESIAIRQWSLEDIFYANLLFVLLPEYVDAYVIDL